MPEAAARPRVIVMYPGVGFRRPLAARFPAPDFRFHDAAEPEPLPPCDPLWDCPNLFISPHLGGRDTRQPDRLLALIEGNLARFLAGGTLLHQVP